MEEEKNLIKQTHSLVGKLYIKLMGDKELKIPGMIDEFGDMKAVQGEHGQRLEKIEKRNFRRDVVIGTASATGGFLGGAFGKAGLIKILSMIRF